MPAAAVLALLLTASSPASIRSIDDPSWWANPSEPVRLTLAQDTTLIAQDADVAHGGDQVLGGAVDRTILIRFPEVAHVVPPGYRVEVATLVLTATGGNPASFRTVSQVLRPWGEGPLRTFMQGFAPTPTTGDKAKEQKPMVAMNAATWRDRLGRRAGWQRPGAQGPEDSLPIELPPTQYNASEVRIEGLAATVQGWVNAPHANHGLALRMASNTDFASAQGPQGRPVLELRLAPVPNADMAQADLAITGYEFEGTNAKVRVSNTGSAPSGTYSVRLLTEERSASLADLPALAPGASAEHTVAIPDARGGNRAVPVTAVIESAGADANPRNQSETRYVGGVDIDWPDDADRATRVRLLAYLNDVVLPMSRFGAVPDGTTVRVNLGGSTTGDRPANRLRTVLQQLGAKPWARTNLRRADFLAESLTARAAEDLAPGLMGYGDTRYDGVVPGRLLLPYEPTDNPVFVNNPLVPGGLLAATDVVSIQARAEKRTVPMPKAVLIRMNDMSGRPIAESDYAIYRSKGFGVLRGAASVTTGKTRNGTAIVRLGEGGLSLPADDSDGGDALYLVRVTRGNQTEDAWFKAWQLVDAAARGNTDIAFVELRYNLSEADIDLNVDLARGKAVTGSDGLFPAQLAALVTPDSAAAVDLGAATRAYVEIDLGRDRTIAEIRLTPDANRPMWNRFRIVGYATGQRVEDASPIAQEPNFAWAYANRSRLGHVSYKGPTPRVRYLRIIHDGTWAGYLRSLEIFPAVLND
ncbi:MAG: hypothetical protein SFX74_05975 [Fimbriimonadaceae bacterium]|nr:hypothetical protein [Fimbriimonadaceae bacterium]